MAKNIPIWLEKVRHGRKITADGRRQIPIWLEKVRHGWKITADTRGKRLKIFPHGWKKSDMVGNYSGWKATNSNMVGNFPQGVRKGVPSHRTFSLFHPSYRREFPILFSISVPPSFPSLNLIIPPSFPSPTLVFTHPFIPHLSSSLHIFLF